MKPAFLCRTCWRCAWKYRHAKLPHRWPVRRHIWGGC